MSDLRYVLLPDRGVLAVEGDDARDFLQGLVSNDVMRVSTKEAIYAALLTPQGKFLHDFFMAVLGDAVLLDCEGARLHDLKRRLGIYRLRSKVTLSDRTETLTVVAAIGDGATAALDLPPEAGAARAVADGDGVVFNDPRLRHAGVRAILPRDRARTVLEEAGFVAGEARHYERLRIGLGLPDGSRDMEIEKAILLECGFDELHGVDWRKGCFVGQELTARTRYRGLIKKRLVPVEVRGAVPAAGTPIMGGDREVGQVRSSADGLALALIRLDALASAEGQEQPLKAGEAVVVPRKPAWAAF